MKTFLLVAAVLFLSVSARAATINAVSCLSTDVMAAVNRAKAGDTVFVPQGTCNWTATGGSVAYCKNINLVGSGNTQITINITPGFTNDGLLFSGCSGILGSITGFTFIYVSADSFGIVMITGDNPVSWRIHHNTFKASGTNVGRFLSMRSPCAAPGCLFDHNTVVDLGFVVQNIKGADAQPGTTAWALPPPFETVKAVYFEDNNFNSPQFATHQVDHDCDSAGAYVFRHNIEVANVVGNHGYDSTPTGCMLQNVYHNDIETNNVTPWNIQSRGGSGVWYDNIINGTASTTPLGVTDYRSDTNGFVGTSGHDHCDGTGAPDQNTAPLASNRGWRCYQQIGLMGPAVSATTFTSFPLYEWNNCLTAIGCTPGGANQRTIVVFPGACTGGICGTSYLSLHVIQNRDYYDQVASFTGATGIGTGTLASRPATCTAGVGYFATDQSTFYQCGAGNAWSVYYQSFQYPHPLTLSSSQLTTLANGQTSSITRRGLNPGNAPSGLPTRNTLILGGGR